MQLTGIPLELVQFNRYSVRKARQALKEAKPLNLIVLIRKMKLSRYL